jgi:DNA-binding PadR family transcriptional regulator
MAEQEKTLDQADKLTLELRRGTLVLATLCQLRSPKYGYSLVQDLARHGLEVEQGTLYPLLRRLDEQGLLESIWNVEGSRPRKYYQLSATGTAVLEQLSAQWTHLVDVLALLLDESKGDRDGAH